MKNTIKLNWAILCTGTSVDQKSNNVTLFGLVEELKIKKDIFTKLPIKKEGHSVIPIKLELATLWSKDYPSDKLSFSEIKIAFTSPKGRVINELTQKLEIPEDKSRLRLIFSIGAIGIEGDGIYSFEIKLKTGESKSFVTVGKVPVYISIVD